MKNIAEDYDFLDNLSDFLYRTREEPNREEIVELIETGYDCYILKGIELKEKINFEEVVLKTASKILSERIDKSILKFMENMK